MTQHVVPLVGRTRGQARGGAVRRPGDPWARRIHGRDLFLLTGACVGLAMTLYGIGESRIGWEIPIVSRYAGLFRLFGMGLVGIIVTVVWPELTLVLLGGGPTHRYVLLPPLGIPTGGLRFLVQAGLLWVAASFVLRQRGRFRRLRLQFDWPSVFLLVIGLWVVVYAGLGYAWLSRSELLDKYVVLSLFSLGAMWYLVFWQSDDVLRSARRLLWAILAVDVGGVLGLMWYTTGSLTALWDPSSPFWLVVQGRSRLTILQGNPIGVAVEILGPAFITCVGLMFSPASRTLTKMGLAAVAAVFGVALVATGTRQAALGVTVAVAAIWLLQLRNRLGQAITVLALSAAIAIPLVANLVPRFQMYGVSRFETIGDTLRAWRENERVLAVRQELQAFQSRPLLGNGVGITGVNADAGFGTHNLFTSVAVELGIVPLFVVLGMFAVLLRAIWVLIRAPSLGAGDRAVIHTLVGLFILAFAGDMASGRMEGGFAFYAWGMPLYFISRSFGSKRIGSRRASRTLDPEWSCTVQ